jgi:hypothetical protein
MAAKAKKLPVQKGASLNNMLMQLRKVCNHPYLFPEVDPAAETVSGGDIPPPPRPPGHTPCSAAAAAAACHPAELLSSEWRHPPRPPRWWCGPCRGVLPRMRRTEDTMPVNVG